MAGTNGFPAITPWRRIPFAPPESRLRQRADASAAVTARGTTGGAWRPAGER